MISYLRFRSGISLELKFVKRRKFYFNPGLNVIVGPNGSGKSLILKTLAAYSCVSKISGGWSSRPKDVGQYSDFPNDLKHYAPDNCEVDLEWDGSPSFFYSAWDSIGFMSSYMFSNKSSLFKRKLNHLSEGQNQLCDLNSIGSLLQAKPKLWSLPVKGKNDHFVEYIRNLPKRGPSTLIIDSPEKGMDIIGESDIWLELLPKLAEQMQIIAATHSLFPLISGINCNLIELEKDYRSVCLANFCSGTINPFETLNAIADQKEVE